MTPIVIETPAAAPPTEPPRGVPDVLAQHTWNGQVQLNTLGATPRVRIDPERGIEGWRSLPASRARADEMPGRLGAIPRFASRGTKALSYGLLVEARSPRFRALDNLDADLLAAFGEDGVQNEGRMLIEPYEAYGGPSWYFDGTVIDYESGERGDGPRSTVLWRAATLSILMHDPRFYRLDEPAPVSSSSTGTGTRSVTVNNLGNAPTDPVIDITGPVVNPRLNHPGMNRDLFFTANGGVNVGAGSVLRVDFNRREVILGPNAATPLDRYSRLAHVTSDWWDEGVSGLTPGSQQVRMLAAAGGSISAGAKITVAWRHASWG